MAENNEMAWHCFCCGECCHKLYPEVTPEEIAFLRARLPSETSLKLMKSLVDFSPYQEEKGSPENKFIRPSCPLLTVGNLCSVHYCKPGACQTWECGRESLEEPFCV